MHYCINCGKENEKYICNNCLQKIDIIELIEKVLNEHKEVTKDTIIFYNNEYQTDTFENIIFDLTENIEEPLKEYYIIKSFIKKFYSVPKIKREYLISNSYICLESNVISDKEKNIINTLLLDAYYKNYQFEEAETIANTLKDEEDIDELTLYSLGDYYICTRRYDLAFDLLNKAISISQKEELKVTINNKIEEGIARQKGRENGGKTPYLPGKTENRIIYQEFMNKVGIDLEIPKVRAKAPDKINIEDYPIPIEITEAGFKTFVAFDLETTGINHTIESITEIAAIRVVDGKIVEEKKFVFQELVHPYRRKIPHNVEILTGITNEMVYNSREIWEVFKDFADFIKDDILLGYNCMAFDSQFLVRAGRLSNIKIENKYFDVMHYVKKFNNKLNYENKTLTNIGELLGITNPNAHRALADSITTAKVYLKLLEMDDDLC